MSDIDRFTVNDREANQRIDKLLVQHYSQVRSRAYFQYLIVHGDVQVNGKPIKKRECPQKGDTIEVHFTLPPTLNAEPEAIPLDTLYEDELLIVINKPAGMVVHPAVGNWNGTVANALLHHCTTLIAQGVRPGIVHRLDKETSGVLLAAKTRQMQQRLMTLFAERRVSKEYRAICLGHAGSGSIDAPICRDAHHRKKMSVTALGGKAALTHFQTLAYDHAISYVALQPITGRTHQLRVHMSHHGHPILGDHVYGNAQANKRFQVGRQLLHAHKLTLPHPVTGEPLVLEAPIPDNFKRWIQQLK